MCVIILFYFSKLQFFFIFFKNKKITKFLNRVRTTVKIEVFLKENLNLIAHFYDFSQKSKCSYKIGISVKKYRYVQNWYTFLN